MPVPAASRGCGQLAHAPKTELDRVIQARFLVGKGGDCQVNLLQLAWLAVLGARSAHHFVRKHSKHGA